MLWIFIVIAGVAGEGGIGRGGAKTGFFGRSRMDVEAQEDSAFNYTMILWGLDVFHSLLCFS